MDSFSVSSISAAKLQQTGAEFGVRVLKGANEQVEAVAAILLDGIKQVMPEHKGQKLNNSA